MTSHADPSNSLHQTISRYRQEVRRARTSRGHVTNVVRRRRGDFPNRSHGRTPAQSRADYGCLRRTNSLQGGTRIAGDDAPARGRARPIPDPLPACLRTPLIARRNTSFVRRGPGPRRHTPAEQATVDSRSRRSANTREVTVDSIRTATTRDSHRHRVPSPCAEYHRALAGQRAALGFRAAPAT